MSSTMNYLPSEGYVWELRPKYEWPPNLKQEQFHSTRVKWRFGNPKKRKLLVTRFARISSVHGTAYVCPGGKVSNFTRLIYRMLFVSCFIMVTVNVFYVVKESYGAESTFVNIINKAMDTGPEEDPEYFPLYPRITICRKPAYQTEFNDSYLQVVEYALLALGYPFTSLTPKEVSYLATIGSYDVAELDSDMLAFRRRFMTQQQNYEFLKRKKDFNVKQFIIDHGIKCDKFFLNCQALAVSFNCCEIFQPVLTSMGLCYSLSNIDTVLNILKSYPMDVAFIMDLISPPTIDRWAEVGFQVFLNDPRERGHELHPFQGQITLPDVTTTISVQLIKTDRTAQHTRWHGRSTFCPTLSFMENGERYSPRECEHYFIDMVLRDKCKCESIRALENHPGLRYCEPPDQYKCLLNHSIKSLSELSKMCHKPCILYSYKSEASFIGLGGKNVSRLEIMYDSKQYAYHEYRTTTLSSLFGQIGGVLGFYLGASIITVVEIVIFVLGWLWYAWMPTKMKFRIRPEHKDPYNKWH